jgi:chromosome segregation ATPase
MSEQATPAGAGQQELQDELDRRQEEILRLRDLLIGKDAELGAAKGRLAELEDPRVQLRAAKQQIVTRALGRLSGIVLRLRGNS